MPGLFYTSYYTNARRILENLLSERIVGFKGFVYRACGVLSYGGHPMAVTVEGKLNAGVPGEVLDVLWVRAASRMVKQVCRRSCQRMSGNPVRLSRGLKCRGLCSERRGEYLCSW
jgi:hypothetical protein